MSTVVEKVSDPGAVRVIAALNRPPLASWTWTPAPWTPTGVVMSALMTTGPPSGPTVPGVVVMPVMTGGCCSAATTVMSSPVSVADAPASSSAVAAVV